MISVHDARLFSRWPPDPAASTVLQVIQHEERHDRLSATRDAGSESRTRFAHSRFSTNTRKCGSIWDVQSKGDLNNPGKLQALKDAGLEIVERVSIEVESSAPAEKYLRTKKEKNGPPARTQSELREAAALAGVSVTSWGRERLQQIACGRQVFKKKGCRYRQPLLLAEYSARSKISKVRR